MIITYCAQKMIRKSNYEFYNKKRGSGKSESKCKSMKLAQRFRWLNFSVWPNVKVTPIFKVSATYSEEEIGPAGVQVDRQLDKWAAISWKYMQLHIVHEHFSDDHPNCETWDKDCLLPPFPMRLEAKVGRRTTQRKKQKHRSSSTASSNEGKVNTTKTKLFAWTKYKPHH